jgi:hypothetical protein
MEATARSRKQIRRLAELVRNLTEKHLGLGGPLFPIIPVVERLLPRLDPEFSLEILEEQEMGDNHGLTIPSQHVIKLREDVYEGACEGKGRDRLTVAHELGHYILHDDLAFPRSMKESEIPAYRSAEWQAKCFSGELLVSAKYAGQCLDDSDAASLFGVSDVAGKYQMKKLREDGLI